MPKKKEKEEIYRMAGVVLYSFFSCYFFWIRLVRPHNFGTDETSPCMRFSLLTQESMEHSAQHFYHSVSLFLRKYVRMSFHSSCVTHTRKKKGFFFMCHHQKLFFVQSEYIGTSVIKKSLCSSQRIFYVSDTSSYSGRSGLTDLL